MMLIRLYFFAGSQSTDDSDAGYAPLLTCQQGIAINTWYILSKGVCNITYVVRFITACNCLLPYLDHYFPGLVRATCMWCLLFVVICSVAAQPQLAFLCSRNFLDPSITLPSEAQCVAAFKADCSKIEKSSWGLGVSCDSSFNVVSLKVYWAPKQVENKFLVFDSTFFTLFTKLKVLLVTLALLFLTF